MNQEPLNFFRQAYPFLREWYPKLFLKDFPIDTAVCIAVLESARLAPKFILPQGGRIFDDKLRGLPDQLRLPFPEIVIEYRGADGVDGIVEQIFNKDKCIPAPKRIIFAKEVDNYICVYSLVGLENSTWSMAPYVACVYHDDSAIAPPKSEELPNNQMIKGIGIKILPTGTKASTLLGSDWMVNGYYDMSDEVNAVLELIEALSCSNVQHEPLPVRKLNKSAAKNGALPFDEYRVLTISSPSFGRSGGRSVDHRAPREHLRRGHIRKHPSAGNIWINSCVVNSGVEGKINKTYDTRGVKNVATA